MFDRLLAWSREHYGDLPWRKKRSMYRALVAEVMLQQTTVNTVRSRFDAFLATFPTLKSLAQAPEEKVVMAWKGLGYYRRAKNLKRACEEVEKRHGGRIPRCPKKLKDLPGIGDYTACALISLGANARALPIDVNIARVLARFYGIKKPLGPILHRNLKERFYQGMILRGVDNYRDMYEALMDLGRSFCRGKRVECPVCPLKASCRAWAQGHPLSYPALPKARPPTYRLDLLRAIVCARGRFLGERRKEGQWLSHQIEVPTFVIKSEDVAFSQYPPLPVALDLTDALVFKTAITKYRITNYVVTMSRAQLRQFSSKRYHSFLLNGALENLSTATMKSFAFLGESPSLRDAKKKE